LFASFEKGTFDLKTITKEPVYFIEQTSAYKALENFKKSKVHYALIVDEHGVFQGIITLNDILEALVGDASDFYDEEFQLVAREDGTWLVDGHYSLHDFLTYFDMDELIWNKLEFEVIDMDGVKIDKILIKNLKESK
jgi:putative hemolysin